MNAGGDWEFPVCFVMYWDGKELRAYIPKDGNAWNKKQKTAYGSEEDMDEDYEVDSEKIEEKEVSEEKIFADVLKRIQPK